MAFDYLGRSQSLTRSLPVCDDKARSPELDPPEIPYNNYYYISQAKRIDLT